jgi:hypothetical protein
MRQTREILISGWCFLFPPLLQASPNTIGGNKVERKADRVAMVVKEEATS